jgi:magnesium chelatase family protein
VHLLSKHDAALPETHHRPAHGPHRIYLEVIRVPFQKLASLDGGEPSRAVRDRVEAAHTLQAERFDRLGKPNIVVNGDMGPAELQHFCVIDEEGKALMRAAVRKMDLSERSYHRVLKLSRTIADLASEGKIRMLWRKAAQRYSWLTISTSLPTQQA